MREIISAFLCLLGALVGSCAAQSGTKHAHPLLGCLDRWEIPEFDSNLYQPAMISGACFSEMQRTAKLESCVFHGWAKRQDKDDYKVLVFGCLEVDVLDFSNKNNSIHWTVTTPIVEPDHKRWGETPLLRGLSKIDSAADLIIIARGYQAAGQRDMAHWLVDQVLARFGSEEVLAKLTANRFAEWYYQVAIDRWLANADWKRLASDLDQLIARAPQDWVYLPAIRDLKHQVSQVPLRHEDENPVKQLMKRSLYGPGWVNDWILMGNWVLFPHSERSQPRQKGRFDDLMSVDVSALLLWADLLADDTPCAYLYSVRGRDPKPGELRRRPSWTKLLARRFIEDGSLWVIEEHADAASIRDQCAQTIRLMSGRNSRERFLAAAELLGGLHERNAAIVGLYDLGYEGSWSEIENQIVKDWRPNRNFPFWVETYVSLRKSEASDLLLKLEREHINRRNQSALKQNAVPDPALDSERGELDRLKVRLATKSLEEVLGKWPEHRGAHFWASPEGAAPLYTTSPTRLIHACLNEAIRTPAFSCDFIELAMTHRSKPNNLIQIPWPGPQTSFGVCRQPIRKLLNDQGLFRLATRARGKGRTTENPAQMTAWMMLDATVEYRSALSFDGYAFLGAEWMDELVKECQKSMDGDALPDLSGLIKYADPMRFASHEEEIVSEALKWGAGDFREKWRDLPLPHRVTLASKPVIPVEGDLAKLRSVVREIRGQPIAKVGDPFTDDALDELIKWTGVELLKSKGACGMVRWGSGLAGVDVETESFSDSSVISQSVIDSFKTAYDSKPGARHLIIVSARRGIASRGWIVEAGSPEQARIRSEWKQWQESIPHSKLAQDSIWLIGIARDVLK